MATAIKYTEQLCFRNVVQYTLFAVKMEIFQNRVSEVSHVTPPSQNYMVRDKVDFAYI